jgi:integration host factor subunit beta
MAVTKSELIGRIQRRFPHLGQKSAESLVNTIFGTISNGLGSGNRVELRGFGAFSVRTREPRTARNPKNGAAVKVDVRHSIYFRAGKELREKINTPEA